MPATSKSIDNGMLDNVFPNATGGEALCSFRPPLLVALFVEGCMEYGKERSSSERDFGLVSTNHHLRYAGLLFDAVRGR